MGDLGLGREQSLGVQILETWGRRGRTGRVRGGGGVSDPGDRGGGVSDPGVAPVWADPGGGTTGDAVQEKGKAQSIMHG